jgi:Asp-tRNA(Asn)/Glu-tRNA(Gln) amidotransferase A subunit family amidase
MDGHVPQATGPLSLGACIGPMARRVEDLDLLFSITADPVQFEASNSPRVSRQDLAPLHGLKVSRYLDDRIAPVTDETLAAIDAAATALQEAGLTVADENPPGFSEGARLWIALFARPAREQLQDLYQGREADAGPLVTAALQAGGPAGDMGARIRTAEDLAAALVEREHLREEILRWMKSTPLVLMPVGATPAFPHGATRVAVGVQSISIFRAFSHTLGANVFGLPSVVVPAGRSTEGLPIGVQIIGRPFEERAVLAAAGIIEETLGGWQRPPAL